MTCDNLKGTHSQLSGDKNEVLVWLVLADRSEIKEVIVRD